MQHLAAKKPDRQSKLFSWMHANHNSTPSATKNDKEVTEDSTKIELAVNDYYCSQKVDLEIPNRRQSHLYTPYHHQVDSDTVSLDNYQYKRRSYLPPSNTDSSSSLTRSATWQPSSQNTPHNNNNNNLNVNDIPTRRTSRNYSENPEIQAKLNAVLNSDKISHIIQRNINPP